MSEDSSLAFCVNKQCDQQLHIFAAGQQLEEQQLKSLERGIQKLEKKRGPGTEPSEQEQQLGVQANILRDRVMLGDHITNRQPPKRFKKEDDATRKGTSCHIFPQFLPNSYLFPVSVTNAHAELHTFPMELGTCIGH